MRQVKSTSLVGNNGGGTVRAIINNSDEFRKLNTAAGKVVLAAIVHNHDTINSNKHTTIITNQKTTISDNTNDGNNNKTNKKERSKSTKRNEEELEVDREKVDKKYSNSGNTHDDYGFERATNDISNLTKGKKKFSRFLFSSKKKLQRQQQQQQQLDTTTCKDTLIDDAQKNKFPFRDNKAIVEIDQNDDSQAYQKQHSQKISPNLLRNTNNEPVIEFKFDLIVDQQEYEHDRLWKTTTKTQQQQQPSEHILVEFGDEMMRLENNVNELVESFVLDSNDVCLMSTGKQRINLNKSYQSSDYNVVGGNNKVDEFDYLNKLMTHTLAYSFELLENKKKKALAKNEELPLYSNDNGFDSEITNSETNKSSDLTKSKNSNSMINYSIELSATLLFSGQEKPLEVMNPKDVCFSCNDGNDDYGAFMQNTTSKITNATEKSSTTYNSSSGLPPTHCLMNELGNYFEIVDLLSCETELNGFSEPNIDGTNAERPPPDGSDCLTSDEIRSRLTNGKENCCTSGGLTDVNGQYMQQSYVECSNFSQAIKIIDRLKDKMKHINNTNPLAFLKQSRKLLIVSLKLKQRINGGIFSNRMCLIDFDPNFVELHSIFESIFNGQALAHLKRHKLNYDHHHHHQQQQQQQHKQQFHCFAPDSLSNPTEFIKNFDQVVNDMNTSANDDVLKKNLMKQKKEKQHHQVASLNNKLIQAEWLLYKQLNSVLIRTLIIVHVNKLSKLSFTNSSTENILDKNNDCFINKTLSDQENELIRENLVLLEFARSIQKASSIRLKRRKRHLRSHLASSNVSIASNVSATTTNDEHNTYHQQQSHLLSSPINMRRSRYQESQTKINHNNNNNNQNQYNNALFQSKKVINDLNLAIGGGRRDHNRSYHPARPSHRCLKHHHHHHHHHHHRNQHHSGSLNNHIYNRTICSSSSNSNRQYPFIPDVVSHRTHKNHSDVLTESSSMSTSSGSQRAHQNQSIRSLRATHHSNNNDNNYNLRHLANYDTRGGKENFCSPVNNLSDSDSVTSANLNSCSSSSFNRLPFSSITSNVLQNKSKYRRDVELKWITKQSRQLFMSNDGDEDTKLRERRRISARGRGGGGGYCSVESGNNSGSSPPIELTSLCTDDGRRIKNRANSSASIERSNCEKGSSGIIQIDCRPKQHLNVKGSESRTLAMMNGNSSGRPMMMMTNDVIDGDGDIDGNGNFNGVKEDFDDNGHEPVNCVGFEPARNSFNSFGQSLEDNTDNVSDICSVIAEPPKQLRLEEFLNQLSSVIAPMTNTSTTTKTKAITPCKNSISLQNGDITTTTTISQDGDDKMDLNMLQQQSIEGCCILNADSESNSNGYFVSHFKTSEGCNETDGATIDHDLVGGDKGDDSVSMDNNASFKMTFADINRKSVGFNNNRAPDEDDDDCKSHSSILEHLSSLALESNNKLNNRQQLQQSQPKYNSNIENETKQQALLQLFNATNQQEPLMSPTLSEFLPTMIDKFDDQDYKECSKHQTGHLQRLLNSSSQLRGVKSHRIDSRVIMKDSDSVEEQLRALTISCNQTPPLNELPSSSSSALGSSNASSCISNSSTAEQSGIIATKLKALNTTSPMNMVNGDNNSNNNNNSTSINHLYASVTRNHHQDVKT